MQHTKSYIKDYPRPQLVREKWQSLNGVWRFAFGDRIENIFESDRTVNVPFPPEYKPSGIGELADDGYVTYGRKITVKKKAGERVFLHFEGVDYIAELFVNGKFAAKNIGAYSRFSADITEFVADGENSIVLRVFDSLNRAQVRGKQRWENNNNAVCHYVQYTGIWKSVWLEYTGSACVKSIVPQTKGNDVTFKIATDGADRYSLTLTVSRGKKSYVATGEFDTPDAELSLTVADAEKWSPDHPALYDVVLDVAVNGKSADSVKSYFGFRDIAADGNKITVNGKPEYLRMILDQGYFGECGATPPDEDALRNDVEIMKAMGLNGARKHQKTEDERFLYYCDLLGLYLWCEMPSTYGFDLLDRKEFADEWIRIVNAHRSHPCVIAYVPFNESWGVDEIAGNKEIQAFVNDIVALTKKTDGSRFVISNDGWEHTNSDLLTIHQYEQDAEKFVRGYDFEKTVKESELCSRRPYCEGYGYGGQPILFTEFGGCSFKRDEMNDAWGYGNSVADEKEFAARLKSLIHAVEEMPFCTGWCYTQLTDVQQEVNGLLGEDRKPKLPISEIRKIVLGGKRGILGRD